AAVRARTLRLGVVFARGLRVDSVRRHAPCGRPGDPASGDHAECRRALYLRDALARCIRRDDGRLVLGQQLRPPRRPARRRAHDLGRDRHWRLDHGCGHVVRLAQLARYRARPGRAALRLDPKWGIVTQPLAFILFLTAGIAATKRIPFDMPEGESEIIGYFVEYSGMKFGMF